MHGDTMGHENKDSFITINSIKKGEGRKLLQNGELNFKSKHEYLKPKLNSLTQKQLIDIALKDRSWQIRRLALKKIKNPRTVFKIAFNDKSEHVRGYFLKNYDESVKHVALNDPSANLRSRAIEFIQDIGLLRYIASKDSSSKVRLKAALKLKDKRFLKEVLNSDFNFNEMRNIINEINDDELLFEMFQHLSLYDLKMKIIKKIKDPEIQFELYKYVLDDSYYRDYREEVIHNLNFNDEDKLFKAFELETDSQLKALIFSKFKTANTFEKVFLHDSDAQFKCDSISHVENQDILMNVIYGDFTAKTKLNAFENLNQKHSFDVFNDLSLDNNLRLRALSNIRNDDFLIDVCRNAGSISVILSALSNIDDEEFVRNFGLEHENWKVRSLAISKIDDNDLLMDFAMNDPFWFSRKVAVLKIHDDEKLVEILSDEQNPQIISAIVNSIERPEILLDLLKKGYVNWLDEARINDLNDETLFYIAINHENISFRGNAIDKLIKRKNMLDIDHDDFFYKYLMNIEQEDYERIKFKIGDIINDIKNAEYLKNLALCAKHDIIRCYAIASDNFNAEFSEDELIECILTVLRHRDDWNIVNFKDNAVLLASQVNDERRLFDLIVNHSGKDKYNQTLFDMLGFIENEELLYEIAFCNHLSLSLKTLAVKGIKNQKMLNEIVLTHPDAYVRNQAISSIEDKDLMKHLALNDPSHIIRKSALLWNEYERHSWTRGIQYDPVGDASVMISNEQTLEEIILKSHDKRIRHLGFNMIHDEKILCRIAEKSRDVEIRKMATQSIKNQKKLMDIALNDPSRIVKKTAVGLLEEDNLRCIIHDFHDWYIRDYALGLIDDDSLILDFAFNDSNWHVRNTGVSKISDENILKEIALTDNNINIRKSAIEKITSLEILSEILFRTIHRTTPNIVEKKLRRCLYE